MARSARLGAWLGENLHVLNPVLFLYTKAMPKLITPLYNAFGVPGLVALPWVMLSLEKVAYDTFTAARGHDMYTEAQETGQNPHGEFPSGGGRSWFEMAHLWPRWRQRRPQSPTSRLPRGRRACLAYRGALLGSPSSLEWRRTVRLRAHPAETRLAFHPTGAKLPSFSLIAVRGEEDRLIISVLGDEPRKPSSRLVAAVTSPVTSSPPSS